LDCWTFYSKINWYGGSALLTIILRYFATMHFGLHIQPDHTQEPTHSWDGTVNRTSYPPNNIAPAGLYTFDITVNGKTPNGLVLNYDKDRMRSSALKIGDHDVVMIGRDKYRVSYVLNDTKDAFQAGVDAYDPDLQWLTGIKDGTVKAPAINTPDMDVQTDICGTYRFVFWAIDDHRELDKAHRRKPALEVNKAYTIPSAANFAFDTIWPDEWNNASSVAEDAAAQQREVYHVVWDSQNRCFRSYITKYGEWKWSKTVGKDDWVYESMVQINKNASQVIKALNRVACFSWVTHSIEGSGGAVVVFYGPWWHKDTYIAAYPGAPGTAGLPSERTWYISYLPDLSHLVCVFLLNCTSRENPDPENPDNEKIMVDTIFSKGAQFVGTVVGGLLHLVFQAKPVAKRFWKYASKIIVENGGWRLYSLPWALERAVREVLPSEREMKWGTSYLTTSGYRPYARWRDPGYPYLGPARGGKTDDQLKRMGPNP